MGRGGGGLGVVWNDDESLETREVMIAQHREYIKCTIRGHLHTYLFVGTCMDTYVRKWFYICT